MTRNLFTLLAASCIFATACGPRLDNPDRIDPPAEEPETEQTAIEAGTIEVDHPVFGEYVFDGFYVENAPRDGRPSRPFLMGGTGFTWELLVDPDANLAGELEPPYWMFWASAPHDLRPEGAFAWDGWFEVYAETQRPAEDGYHDWWYVETEQVIGFAQVDEDDVLTATYEFQHAASDVTVHLDAWIPLVRPDGDVDEGDPDGDGIPTYVEDSGPEDPDGDGVPSSEDLDSDGDGVPDADEHTWDHDGDGMPDYLDRDSDGDGILDQLEGDVDSDADGDPDRIDIDSDGDGILDAFEREQDIDGDGLPNYLDWDSDGDGIIDPEDDDYDGDGIPDSEEWTDTIPDSDGDGTPDPFDAD